MPETANRTVRLIAVPWLIPAWARAQVWWNLILINQGVVVEEELLAHELVHVTQWQTLGMVPFLFHYLKDLIRYGYERHPLEREARDLSKADFYREWARQILARELKVKKINN
jgi:hypothetical protein